MSVHDNSRQGIGQNGTTDSRKQRCNVREIRGGRGGEKGCSWGLCVWGVEGDGGGKGEGRGRGKGREEGGSCKEEEE